MPSDADALLDRALRAAADRHHRDDRADADHDAEHREQRAQLVRAQRAERDGDDFAEEHRSILSRRGRRERHRRRHRRRRHRGPPPPGAATAGAAFCVEARHAHVLARAVVLLPDGCACSCSALSSDDAVAFLQAADDFGVVEVALAELDDARREVLVRRVRRDEEALVCLALYVAARRP